MTVKCTECGAEWKKPGTPGDPSSSFCKRCMTPIVRRHQLHEGNFPCFATADGYCDQGECKYREFCL